MVMGLEITFSEEIIQGTLREDAEAALKYLQCCCIKKEVNNL